DLVLLTPRQGPGPAALRLDGEDDVLAHAEVTDDALVAPVLARERDAIRQRGGRLGDVGGAATQAHLAGVGLVGAVDEAREFGAAGSEQAGEADDLTAVQIEVDLFEHALLADADGRVDGVSL